MSSARVAATTWAGRSSSRRASSRPFSAQRLLERASKRPPVVLRAHAESLSRSRRTHVDDDVAVAVGCQRSSPGHIASRPQQKPHRPSRNLTGPAGTQPYPDERRPPAGHGRPAAGMRTGFGGTGQVTAANSPALRPAGQRPAAGWAKTWQERLEGDERPESNRQGSGRTTRSGRDSLRARRPW